MMVIDSAKCPDGLTINDKNGSRHIAAGASLSGIPECVLADLCMAGIAVNDSPLILDAAEAAKLKALGFSPETLAPFTEASA